MHDVLAAARDGPPGRRRGVPAHGRRRPRGGRPGAARAGRGRRRRRAARAHRRRPGAQAPDLPRGRVRGAARPGHPPLRALRGANRPPRAGDARRRDDGVVFVTSFGEDPEVPTAPLVRRVLGDGRAGVAGRRGRRRRPRPRRPAAAGVRPGAADHRDAEARPAHQRPAADDGGAGAGRRSSCWSSTTRRRPPWPTRGSRCWRTAGGRGARPTIASCAPPHASSATSPCCASMSPSRSIRWSRRPGRGAWRRGRCWPPTTAGCRAACSSPCAAAARAPTCGRCCAAALPDPREGDVGNGHPRATGGALPADEFERLLAGLAA